MGFLAYQIGNSEVIMQEGTWTEIENISNIGDSFFVSDFLQNSYHKFSPSSQSSKIQITLNTAPDIDTCTKNLYLAKVEQFKNFCKSETDKVVLSTILSKNINTDSLLIDELFNKNTGGLKYLISSEKLGVWMGVTPEKIVCDKGGVTEIMSLAGTLPINSAQTWTEKEHKEQNTVTEFIANVLRELDLSYKVTDRQELKAGQVRHLLNVFSISGLTLLDKLSLARRLHPTPALSGMPVDNAVEFIERNEGYDRELYTGLIGFVKAEEVQIYANLRCAQLFENTVFTYVGGGINNMSVADKEWEEINIKSKTVLNLFKK